MAMAAFPSPSPTPPKLKYRRPPPKRFTMTNVMKILLLASMVISFSTILMFLGVLHGAESNTDAPSLSIRALHVLQTHKSRRKAHERRIKPYNSCIDENADLNIIGKYFFPLNASILRFIPLGVPVHSSESHFVSSSSHNSPYMNDESQITTGGYKSDLGSKEKGDGVSDSTTHEGNRRVLQRSYGRRFDLDALSSKFETWNSGKLVCRRWVTSFSERLPEKKNYSVILSLNYAYRNASELKREGWNDSEMLHHAFVDFEPASMALSFWAENNGGSHSRQASSFDRADPFLSENNINNLGDLYSHTSSETHRRSLKGWFFKKREDAQSELSAEDAFTRVKNKIREALRGAKIKDLGDSRLDREKFVKLSSVKSLTKSPREHQQTSGSLLAMAPFGTEWISIELCTSPSVPLLSNSPHNGLGVVLSFLKAKENINYSFLDPKSPSIAKKDETKRECNIIAEPMLYYVPGEHGVLNEFNLTFVHPFSMAKFAVKWESNCNVVRHSVFICLLSSDGDQCLDKKMERCIETMNNTLCMFYFYQLRLIDFGKERVGSKANDSGINSSSNNKGANTMNVVVNDVESRKNDESGKNRENTNSDNDDNDVLKKLGYVSSDVDSIQISSIHWVHKIHFPSLPAARYKYRVLTGDKWSSNSYKFRVLPPPILPIFKHLNYTIAQTAEEFQREGTAAGSRGEKVSSRSNRDKHAFPSRGGTISIVGSKRGRLARAEVKLGRKGPLTRKAYQRGPVGVSLLDFDGSDFMHIALISDSQSGINVFRRHLSHIRFHKPPPDLFLHLGDRIQNKGDLREWDRFWSFPLEERSISQSIPHLGVLGNHDADDAGTCDAFALVSGQQGSGWYAMTVGDCLFIGLDSNLDPKVHPAQSAWLSDTLASLAEARRKGLAPSFVVVLVHVAPFIDYWDPKAWRATKTHPGDWVRLDWVPLFEKFRVDIVISGHSHVYQRGERNGVVYVVTGGGGGAVDRRRVEDWSMYKKTFLGHHYVWVDVSSAAMSLTVFDLTNNPVDHVTFEPDDFFLT